MTLNKALIKLLKKEELRKLNLSEKEQIKLIKSRIKQQKKNVIERYEKKKENLGKTLLRRKNQELTKHLAIEKNSLSKTNKIISKVKSHQKRIR